MVKSVQLSIVSRGLYVLSIYIWALGSILLTLLVSTQILERLNYKPNQFIFVALAILFWYLIDKLTKSFPRGKVELILDREGVQLVWIKQFFLHKKKNMTVRWEDIKDYMYQPEQYFDLFRIRLHNKEKIKLSLDEGNEEFYFFYLEFEEFMKELSSSNQNIKIKRSKTIYETTYGLIMAVILGLLIIGGLLMFIFIKPKNSSLSIYFYLGATVVGGLFYILQVYRMRQSAKENDR